MTFQTHCTMCSYCCGQGRKFHGSWCHSLSVILPPVIVTSSNPLCPLSIPNCQSVVKLVSTAICVNTVARWMEWNVRKGNGEVMVAAGLVSLQKMNWNGTVSNFWVSWMVWGPNPPQQVKEIFLFSEISRLVLGSTCCPSQWLPGSFPGGWSGQREVNHWHPISTKCKNEWSCTSAVPVCPYGMYRVSFTVTLSVLVLVVLGLVALSLWYFPVHVCWLPT